MDKREISRILEEIGLMLEIKGENPFKVRAYTNGARIVETLEGDIGDYIVDGKIIGIKGIGEALSDKILELYETGKLEYYENLKNSIPSGLFDILKIQGIGPKKAKVLYEKLGITNVGELEYACKENRLIGLDGFGEKTQSKILKGIEDIKKFSGQYLYGYVVSVAESIKNKLLESPLVIRCDIAGSLRRKKEIVKDIDILASSDKPLMLMNYFTTFEEVDKILSKGDTKTSVRLKLGIMMDLRVVEDFQYPYALHHFTGSKQHNTALRHRGKAAGIKINEYGLFKGDELIPCKDEQDIFNALGLDYIPPELRENTGEIEEAEKRSLPKLIEYKDIKGAFHIHTNYSDGSSSIEDMAEAARRMGLSYIGISDHSRSAFYANGLKEDDIKRQIEEIERYNAKCSDFKIFKGIEADILPDGSLDYDDEILYLFDFVIASVHSNLGMSRDKMTARVINAVKNRHTTILGHMTSRILLAREACDMDVYAVIDAAAENDVIIEINSDPHRLDLDWRYIKYAKSKGVKFGINPDAHSIEGLNNIRFGVGIARKGWLEAGDIINSMSLKELGDYFERHRR
ncbi:DNA polymerase/3'-5' exonuclease PolX [Lutispora thermophila]|uniref:DNA polymerase beta n=1 Tax=Lutispora thermophila DSM 19022 TaxID=1122184 RepID=A0A1M6CLK6_9FIRM|nr:DNA polymerase/3'-5' exonuclease PolX [Lutispora thermophila]SHI61870.1 DNA polymerase (family 10) [Lutispora thermophila DSM 19022]